MTKPDDPLVKATKDLTDHVQDLSERLSAKEILAKRTRMLTIVAVFVSALGVGGVVAAGYAIEQNADDAKTVCENANQTREAQRNIWNFLFKSTDRNDPEVTKDDLILLDRLEKYINIVFAERNCDDLSKEYPLPPPPLLLKKTS